MSKGLNSNFPRARTADLISEPVGDELVVYDGQSSEAHCLSALASAVFAAADGNTSPADLAAIASAKLGEPVDVPTVEQALTELEDRGLVEVGGVSRRGFMQRSAAVGGAAFAATMVTSVLTPAYGMAGSLPTGVPGSYSSVAIEFDDNGTYYGLHLGSSNSIPVCDPTSNSNNSWGTSPGNGPNCTINDPAIVSGTPSWSSGVCVNLTSGGMVVTGLPSGVTITAAAVWFGQGGTAPCAGCIYAGSNVTSSTGTNNQLIITQTSTSPNVWTITFPPACYGL